MAFEIWKTRDGRQVKVVEMTDLHLLLTIRAIQEGRCNPQEGWQGALEAEAVRRGLDWTRPPTRRVSLLEWIWEQQKWHQVSLMKVRDLLKGAGITCPEIDVSNLDGKVTYLHWQEGGTPVGEGGDSPAQPELIPERFWPGDRVEVVGVTSWVGWVGTIEEVHPAREMEGAGPYLVAFPGGSFFLRQENLRKAEEPISSPPLETTVAPGNVPPKPNRFRVGDQVRVVDRRPADHLVFPYWDNMDWTLNQKGKVVEVLESQVVRVQITSVEPVSGKNHLLYRTSWLVHLDSNENLAG